MKIFFATTYSSKVNYDTGEVFPEYKEWLEDKLTTLESFGHTVFCALRADNYKVNSEDPAGAFSLDEAHISSSDAMLAFVSDEISAGVQTEIGMAIAKGKKVVLLHDPEHKLAYFNDAIVRAGQAKAATLPLDIDPFIS